MSGNWTDEELSASVKAYVEMRELDLAGKPYTKTSYYSKLAKEYGRTEKSYEYRMQNISYVYSLQGRSWITGLKPARNVGANVIENLERLISECEGQQLGLEAKFISAVEKLKKKPAAVPPVGNKAPVKNTSTVTKVERDPEVVAWVLCQAAGKCECCGNEAPFRREDGSPYLEVHHVHQLSDGGEDTISNAIAVCPNCHRELHYGSDKNSIAKDLHTKVQRMQRV